MLRLRVLSIFNIKTPRNLAVLALLGILVVLCVAKEHSVCVSDITYAIRQTIYVVYFYQQVFPY